MTDKIRLCEGWLNLGRSPPSLSLLQVQVVQGQLQPQLGVRSSFHLSTVVALNKQAISLFP